MPPFFLVGREKKTNKQEKNQGVILLWQSREQRVVGERKRKYSALWRDGEGLLGVTHKLSSDTKQRVDGPWGYVARTFQNVLVLMWLGAKQ